MLVFGAYPNLLNCMCIRCIHVSLHTWYAELCVCRRRYYDWGLSYRARKRNWTRSSVIVPSISTCEKCSPPKMSKSRHFENSLKRKALIFVLHLYSTALFLYLFLSLIPFFPPLPSRYESWESEYNNILATLHHLWLLYTRHSITCPPALCKHHIHVHMYI